MTPYDYLTLYHGWHATRSLGSTIYGPCPIHRGDGPNFVIYARDWHWHCYVAGCEKHGDLVRLVKELEFPELGEDYKSWGPIFRRVEELEGRPLPSRHTIFQPRRAEHPAATREQQEVLTAATTWYHQQLHSLSGLPAWNWLEERGIHCQQFPQVGFAPSMQSRRLRQDFTTWMAREVGHLGEWHKVAISVGLLTQEGKHRLQNRIMFSCINSEGRVVFYQARTILEGGERAKYLNPTGLRKVPFFLPIAEPQIPGFLLGEGPKETAILAPYGIPCGVPLGSGLTRAMLDTLVAAFGEPVWIATNNERGPVDPKTGEVGLSPGDKLAKQAIHFCQEGGPRPYEYYRLLPPRADKDLDTWIHKEGTGPLLAEIARCQKRATSIF